MFLLFAVFITNGMEKLEQKKRPLNQPEEKDIASSLPLESEQEERTKKSKRDIRSPLYEAGYTSTEPLSETEVEYPTIREIINNSDVPVLITYQTKEDPKLSSAILSSAKKKPNNLFKRKMTLYGDKKNLNISTKSNVYTVSSLRDKKNNDEIFKITPKEAELEPELKGEFAYFWAPSKANKNVGVIIGEDGHLALTNYTPPYLQQK